MRRSLPPAAYLFAGVFLVRLFVLARFTASPLLLPLHGDMYFYNDWAQRILRGEWTDHLAFYGLPGYAYLLAILYKLFGYSPFVPGFLQALLEGGTAVLIYKITLRLFSVDRSPNRASRDGHTRRFLSAKSGEFPALGAALGWTFFVPAQTYSVILMPTAWLIFAFWFVVWRIIRKHEAPSLKECLFLGLLMGGTATAIATILFLIPLVMAATLFKPSLYTRHSWRGPVFGITALLFGVVAGTSPCWIHNYFVARDPVVLSAHSGINFWIGNNPAANGYPQFPPGLRAGQAAMLEDSITSAELAAGRPLKRSEVSAYWSGQARNYIAHHPAEWFELLLTKLRNFWSAFQYDDLSVITSLREGSVTLPGIYYGLIAAFALPGIFLLWSIYPLSRWVAAAILLHMLALLTVFVTERYRLAAVPGLLIFAAASLSCLSQTLMAGDYRRVVIYLGLLAASTMVVSWPQQKPSLWALDAYNSGREALDAGNLALAEKNLLLAHAYVPTNPETNFALGNLRFAQGESGAASSFYLITLKFDETHRGALNNLGLVALQNQNYDAAETWFRRALSLDPRNSKTHFLLAKVLLAEGRHEPAQRELDIAIELNPSQPEFKQFRQELEHSPP